MIVLRLEKDLRKAIRRGHPWIFDRAVRAPARPLAPGEVVGVADRAGLFGVGFADPGAAIRIRMLGLEPDLEPGDAWARERASSAGSLRLADPTLASAEAKRAIHGEGDRMPGLVVDLYRDTAVAVFDGEGARAFWEPRVGAVVAGLRGAGLGVTCFYARGIGALVGDEPREPISFLEGGARFSADVRRGHKTGWFLDQRDNRALVRCLAAGAEVLDLFAYSGGFAVQAALGGARRVTAVDAAGPAIDAARAHFWENGIDPADHELVVADVFDFLGEAAQRRRRFDLVVCDPPSFAPSERARPRALTAYRRLGAAALEVTAPGGLFCTASCSSHVSERDLFEVTADAAARTGRHLRVLYSRGAGPDHPVLPGFPEGRYLSFLVCYVD